MNVAITDVKNGKKLCAAASEHNVPVATLSRRVKSQQTKKPGGQLQLSFEFEAALLEVLDTLTDWRVTIDSITLHLLLKDYLDR